MTSVGIEQSVQGRVMRRVATVDAMPARRRWPGRVLVATAGSPTADSALLAAKAIADRRGSSVELLAVFRPSIPVPRARDDATAQCERHDRPAVAAMLRAVRRQRRLTRLPRAPWPLCLDVGDPASRIAMTARSMQADLVVVGLGRPEPGSRTFGDATPARLGYLLDVPLLATARDTIVPARSALLVLPETRMPWVALAAAFRCLDDDGTLWVLPAPPSVFDQEARDVAADLEGALDAMHRDDRQRREVALLPPPMGDSVATALRVADLLRADLLVTPVHGVPCPIRALLPSLAKPLLMSSTRSVLVVPLPVGA